MSTEARDHAWEKMLELHPFEFTDKMLFESGWNAALSSPPVTASDEELLTAYHGDNQHGHLVNSDHLARLRRVAALVSPAAVPDEETATQHRYETRPMPSRTDGGYTDHFFVRDVTFGSWREVPYKESWALRQSEPLVTEVNQYPNVYHDATLSAPKGNTPT